MLRASEAIRLKTILGIDPGSRLCGWGIVRQTRNEVTHVDNGVIVLNPNAPLPNRLAVLHETLMGLIQKHAPTDAAIESVFQHRNAQSALVLGHARGTALTCIALHDLAVNTYAPTEIKKLVAGHGRASKEQMQLMVARHLQLTEPPQSDAADATAAALCHAMHLRLGRSELTRMPPRKKHSKKQSDALLMKLAQTRR